MLLLICFRTFLQPILLRHLFCCTRRNTIILMNPAINYYHKALHLGCCSSPRSASGSESISDMLRINLIRNKFILRVYVICYAYMLYITRICYMLRVYVICYAYMSYVSRICYCLKIMESIEMMDSFQMK